VRRRRVTFKVTQETYISPCDADPVKIQRAIKRSDHWEDDVKLVQLDDVYGKETYINADCVKYLKFHSKGTTVIHFGKEDIVVVKMEPIQVAWKLAGAELDAIGRPRVKGPAA
jgi:hypothetical protein